MYYDTYRYSDIGYCYDNWHPCDLCVIDSCSVAQITLP